MAAALLTAMLCAWPTVICASEDINFKATTIEGVEVNYYTWGQPGTFCWVGTDDKTPCIDTSTTGTVTIPATVNGYKVIGIWAYAFQGCTGITKVIFEGGPYSDEEYDYYTIKWNAFDGCTALQEFVTTQNKPFDLNSNAFLGCESLKNADFLVNATQIQGSAFEGCTSLESATFGSKLYNIGYGVFQGCTSLKTVTFQENDKLSDLPSNLFEDANLEGTLDLRPLKEVTSSGKFSGMTALTTVLLPEGTRDIDYEAFMGCTALANVNLKDLNDLRDIEGYAFANTAIAGKVIIPSGVQNVGEAAFQNCTAVTDVFFYPNDRSFSWGITSSTINEEFNGPAGTTIHLAPEVYEDVVNNTNGYPWRSFKLWYTANPAAVVPIEYGVGDTFSTIIKQYNMNGKENGGDTYIFRITNDTPGSRTVTLVGTQRGYNNNTGNGGSAILALPSTVTLGEKTYTLTKIAKGAMSNIFSKTMVIPTSVREIEQGAFCSKNAQTSLVLRHAKPGDLVWPLSETNDEFGTSTTIFVSEDYYSSITNQSSSTANFFVTGWLNSNHKVASYNVATAGVTISPTVCELMVGQSGQLPVITNPLGINITTTSSDPSVVYLYSNTQPQLAGNSGEAIITVAFDASPLMPDIKDTLTAIVRVGGESYGIRIGGVLVTSLNYQDIPCCESGKVSYSLEDSTFTFRDAVLKGSSGTGYIQPTSGRIRNTITIKLYGINQNGGGGECFAYNISRLYFLGMEENAKSTFYNYLKTEAHPTYDNCTLYTNNIYSDFTVINGSWLYVYNNIRFATNPVFGEGETILQPKDTWWRENGDLMIYDDEGEEQLATDIVIGPYGIIDNVPLPITVATRVDPAVEAKSGEAVTTESGVVISLGDDDTVEAAEGCVTVTTTMTTDELAALLETVPPSGGKGAFTDRFKGIFFMLSAGSGYIDVDCETLGDYELTVMMDSKAGEAHTYTSDTKGVFHIEYTSATDRWVFIFPSVGAGPVPARSASPVPALEASPKGGGSEGALKIYGLNIVPQEVVAHGDVNNDKKVDVADIASILSVMAGTSTYKYSDVNGDCRVDVADIASVLTVMAGL